MRRKDREVTDREQIKEILNQCKICHLAMVEDGMPYVVPLSYGYELKENMLILYFHSAKEGHKIDILQKNNKVCFELCCKGEVIYTSKNPCNSGYDFSSVQGFGQVEFITDIDEKCQVLTVLMRHQVEKHIIFSPEQAKNVCVFKVISTSFTGKKKG